MMKHDYSIEVIFKFLDKNNSDGVSIQELTAGLKPILTEEESRVFFDAVDADKSGELSYNEIINECSKINCAYALKKINDILKASKEQTPDSVFKLFDSSRNDSIDILEFNDMMNFLYDKINKYEVDCLFRHFDVKGMGHISKEDFKKALITPLSFDNKIETTVNELISPLKTTIGLMKISPAGIYDKFSKDKKQITL